MKRIIIATIGIAVAVSAASKNNARSELGAPDMAAIDAATVEET